MLLQPPPTAASFLLPLNRNTADPSVSRLARPLTSCGVSLAWLRQFAARVPGSFSTSDVVQRIVKPEAGKNRYVDSCVEPEFVAAPVYFVSHCWSSPFSALVESLEAYLKGENEKSFVWLDIFAINQSPGAEQQDDLGNLQRVIGACESTLLILDGVGLTLTRVWCLYEVWHTVERGAEQLLVLAHNLDASQLTDVFNNLDVSKAQATVEVDRLKILAEIEESIGHEKLNQILKRALVDSAVAEGLLAQDGAASISTRGVTRVVRSQANRAATLTKCGEMLRMYGRPAEAVPMFRLALKLHSKLNGDGHTETATAMVNLAVCLDDHKGSKEAEPLHRKALKLREKLFGMEHADVASSVNGLAVCLIALGKTADAEPLFRRAISLRSRLLGAESPAAMSSFNSLAVCLDEQGRAADAEPMYRLAITMRTKSLGAEHPDTARSINTLAMCLNDQGKSEDAEPLYRRVIEMRTRLLGVEHRDTLASISNLAICLHEQNRQAEAEPLYRQVLEIRSRVLGAQHADTRVSLSNLNTCISGE